MANNTSKVSFFNTLIFTIVSGVISLILLLALFLDVGKQFAYTIIVVEIGIFSVISMCIYQIIKNEKKLNKEKTGTDDKISFDKCPDYFTKVYENDNTVCKNDFTVITPRGQQMKLRIYPVDANIPLPLTLPSAYQGKCEKFNLYQIEQNADFKSAQDQCAIILNEPPVSLAKTQAERDKMAQYEHYSKTPWTYARSKCSKYVD